MQAKNASVCLINFADDKAVIGLKMLICFTPSTGRDRKSAKDALDEIIVVKFLAAVFVILLLLNVKCSNLSYFWQKALNHF